MCSINKQKGKNQLLLMVKGAPERVINMCSTILHKNQIMPMTDVKITIILYITYKSINLIKMLNDYDNSINFL